jgi:hypothetical protein
MREGRARGCIALTCALALAAGPVRAQGGGAMVSGEISFSGSGDLTVILVDAGTFMAKGEGLRRLVLHPSPEESRAGSVRFAFQGLPPGEYGIKAFLDRNGNGIHDKNFLGIPVEPWGMSWRGKKPLGFPRFADMSFRVQGDAAVDIAIE